MIKRCKLEMLKKQVVELALAFRLLNLPQLLLLQLKFCYRSQII